MTPIEENAQLATDLDCQFKDLLRVLHFYPIPGNLVQITDPRLFDDREMLPGSVINESVSPHAAIVQSKLNLNGVMPPAWFVPPGPPPAGSDEIDQPAPPVWAARGDLAELIQRKGAPNGYAAVDENLRLLPANVTPGAGLGTVSEVLFSFPEQFDVTQAMEGAGGFDPNSIPGLQGWWKADSMAATGDTEFNFNVSWKDAPSNSWFGVFGDVTSGIGMGPIFTSGMAPAFHVEQLPTVNLPDLPASKFTTGQFDPEVLPVGVFGEGHASGIAPDPGDFGDGDPDEYLGRDMNYHHLDLQPFYQPQVTQPSITVISIVGDRVNITIRTEVPGALLFYRLGRPSFRECTPEFHLQVPRGVLLEAYSAKEGYRNSIIASYTAPPEDEPGLPDIIEDIIEET